MVDCSINIVQQEYGENSVVLHSNDFLEIAIISEGEGFYRTEFESYPICQGDVFLIPRGLAHGYYSSSNLSVKNILLKNNLVFRAYPEILTEPALCCFRELEPHFRRHDRFQNHLRLSEEELKTLLTFWDFMYQENTLRKEHSASVIGALLHCFLVNLCRFFTNNAGGRSQKLMKLADVLRYVENHYASPISCKDLVRLSGQNRLAFNAFFQEATGHTPRQYILFFRLAKAENMLVNTTMTIKEIAASCGFCDAVYFCQQFKKRHDISPKQYRLEHHTPR